MLLIIGIGNPGEKYQQTRHNIGFTFIDQLQEKLNFPKFVFNKKFNAELSEEIIDNLNIQPENILSTFLQNIKVDKQQKIILIKPQTFMNHSGETVAKIVDFYKIPIENILVIHDDLDLLIGNYKLAKNSSSAGHNGVQSIIENLGTKDFWRLRIGVEKKTGREARQTPGQKFVLQNFTAEEMKILSKNILN